MLCENAGYEIRAALFTGLSTETVQNLETAFATTLLAAFSAIPPQFFPRAREAIEVPIGR
jgi:hypothetical protein